MRKYGEFGGRYEVLSVFMGKRRRLRLLIDSPLFCKPSSVEDIACYQHCHCDQNDYQTVHFCFLLSYVLLFCRDRKKNSDCP